MAWQWHDYGFGAQAPNGQVLGGQGRHIDMPLRYAGQYARKRGRKEIGQALLIVGGGLSGHASIGAVTGVAGNLGGELGGFNVGTAVNGTVGLPLPGSGVSGSLVTGTNGVTGDVSAGITGGASLIVGGNISGSILKCPPPEEPEGGCQK